VEQLREEAAWQKRVAAAHTLPREARAAEGYVLDPTRLQELGTQTLLLLGGESSPFFKAATEALNEALPNSRIVVMPGQGHVAMHTAPELFAGLVVRFLAPEQGLERGLGPVRPEVRLYTPECVEGGFSEGRELWRRRVE
jgi:pimeloyl-ACP methyl ester carboxylesterase